MTRSGLHLSASSVSRTVFDWLRHASMTGRVLSVSRRAWLAQFSGGRLVSIVAPEVGDGPLNVVLDLPPSEWLELEPGALVQLHGDRLQLGPLEVSLERAGLWEPRPNWERLRASAKTLLRGLARLQRHVEKAAPEGSMLLIVQDGGQATVSQLSAVHGRAQSAAEALWAGWCGDITQLSTGAKQLAGLGVGLTPCGDDFLLGTMVCAWLAHPAPSDYCATAIEASIPETTMLSGAYLRSAAKGQFSMPWHRLLAALEAGSDEELAAAVRAVLTYGHTSGADALAGFLWMSQRVLDGQPSREACAPI